MGPSVLRDAGMISMLNYWNWFVKSKQHMRVSRAKRVDQHSFVAVSPELLTRHFQRKLSPHPVYARMETDSVGSNSS